MVVAPPGPRFNVETTLDGTRVTVPARRNWFLILFLARGTRVSAPPAQTDLRRRRAWPSAGGTITITFDYGARTFHFDTGLDEAEAHYLLDLLHPHLPRAA